MDELKGLILSGGRGTRLRPITFTSAKQLVPVANKPVLFYGIEAMAEAGIREIGIIIAPETGDEIRDAAGDGSQFGVAITYIVQDEPGRARPRGPDRRAVPRHRRRSSCTSATTCSRAGWRISCSSSARGDAEALILLTPVPDPQNYGVAELGTEGSVVRLVEKPPEPATDLALVGVYMFTPHDPRGRARDQALRPRRARDHRRDPVAGRRRPPRRAAHRARLVEGHRPARRHARGQPPDPRHASSAGSTASSTTPRSTAAWSSRRALGWSAATVRGPAIIGAGAVVRDAYIGPYTAVGRHCVIERAEVEHSILLEGSSVRGLDGRMESSLLGRDVAISRDDRQPRAYRFMVGDKSEIGIL